MKTLKPLFRAMLLAAGLWCATAAHARSYPNDPFAEPDPLPRRYDNRIGLLCGVQIPLRQGNLPAIPAAGIEYARYSYNNFGFRTGATCSWRAGGIVSVPLQASWRTRRIASAWRRGTAFSETAGYDYMRRGSSASNEDNLFVQLLLSILPSAYELHAGFTPGLIFGTARLDDSASASGVWRHYRIAQRFCASFDLGGRIIFPIGRFGIFGDVTYHLFLTDNFAPVGPWPQLPRSYLGLRAGLSFDF